jgi:uncharacterized protein YifN (PemK superfamily)
MDQKKYNNSQIIIIISSTMNHTKDKQNKSNQIKSNQIKSNQIKCTVMKFIGISFFDFQSNARIRKKSDKTQLINRMICQMKESETCEVGSVENVRNFNEFSRKCEGEGNLWEF